MKTHQLRLDKVITELWWYVRANSRQLGDSHMGTRITTSVLEQHVMPYNHSSQVEEVVESLLGGWKEVGTRELSGLLG